MLNRNITPFILSGLKALERSGIGLYAGVPPSISPNPIAGGGGGSVPKIPGKAFSSYRQPSSFSVDIEIMVDGDVIASDTDSKLSIILSLLPLSVTKR